MMSPFRLSIPSILEQKTRELLIFDSLSNTYFKTIINSYSYYDFNLICRLWESVVFFKNKNRKTNNDVVTLPPLTLISQFVKILKQNVLAENLQTKDLGRPQVWILVPSLDVDVITWWSTMLALSLEP